MHSVCLLSHVQLFATPWTVAHQAPLSIEFFRQEYWIGLPFPSPGDLPDPRIEPIASVAPAWHAGSLPLNHWGRFSYIYIYTYICVYIYPVNSVSLNNTNKIVKIK